MPEQSSLIRLAECLRALPTDASGEFRAHGQVLELMRNKNSLELRLRMKLRSDTSGEPLLMAAIDMPMDGTTPTVRSLRPLSEGKLFGREQRYFDGMVAWALGVLSQRPPQLTSKRKSRPWEKPLKTIVAAATGRNAAVSRRYFKENADSLDEIEDTERALHAIFFLRDAGFVVHVDWKDDDQFMALSLLVLERLALNDVRATLTAAPQAELIESNIVTAANVLDEAGYCLVNIDQGADDHLFLICERADAEAVVSSLQKLGVHAQRREG